MLHVRHTLMIYRIVERTQGESAFEAKGSRLSHSSSCRTSN